MSLGISWAIVAGLLGGTSMLPMRYLSRWQWENVWAIFATVACLVMPPAVFFLTVANPIQVLVAAPARAEITALASGLIWGLGSVLFGLGVSAIGISMANTLVLATSASFGSILPLVLLPPGRFGQPQGKAIVLGTITALVGIGFCGYAGMLRERGERIGPVVPRQMVGFSRPFGVGFLICVASGIASAFINVGYTLSEGIVTKVVQMGNRPFAGSNAIWLFMLGGGAITNLAYCGYLLGKNRTWSNFQHPKTTHLYMLAILMGLLWEGSILAYGSAAPKLGKLGTAIGWPLNLAVSLITANLWGFVTGEWKFSSTRSRRGMIVGLVILLGAIGILGWSSQLTG